MVIGTSLAVFPAASIIKKARYHAETEQYEKNLKQAGVE